MSVWSDIGNLAKRLLGADAPRPVDLSKIDREIAPSRNTKPQRSESQNQSEIEILPEYQFVVEAVKGGCPAIFVTGRAGTGKSTLIHYLSKEIPNCAVLASTALAAINVHGSTIHSFFSIPPRVLNPDEAFNPKRGIVPVIENLGALVIDEVSMVKPDLVDCVSNSLKKVRRDSRPFGGVSVIFVGDLLQLPPVVSDSGMAQYYTDRYRSPNFFSADVFSEVELIPIELKKVFRQTDQQFVHLLDRIRISTDHREAVARINRSCYRSFKPKSARSLFLVPTNAAAKARNTQYLDRLQAHLHKFDAIIEGKINTQRDRFQAPYRLEIKEGAQILFVKNKKPYWLNGTLGKVTNIQKDTLRVEIQNTGNTVTVQRASWEKIQYEYDRVQKRIIRKLEGRFKQFPVTLGWAITIHKSQGMTLDSVRIDLGSGAFCSGQTYVALSRCKTLDGISLARPISMNDVKADQAILDFYKRLFPEKNKRGDQPKSDSYGEIRKRYPRTYEKWSPDEDEQLKRKHRMGLDTSEIAKYIGRTPGAIRSRLTKLGLIQHEAAE